jgi:peptidoglycan/xylan/chitin deacetylase (PgdA/CDA1 family)
MKKMLLLFVVLLFLLTGGQSKPDPIKKEIALVQQNFKEVPQKKTESSPEQILLKPEVPVLCYHRIRNMLTSAGPNMKIYSVTPAAFAQQMKVLSQNGYHTISPDQLKEYLVHNAKLPPKPILITFDDTREEHYTIAAPEMKKYGFKGVFFIMTISINRPKYMTKEQIKNLSDSGNTIGAHSWDHHMVTKYVDVDWENQLTKPNKKLKEIIGKSIPYFAYPNGVWNSAAIPQLKKNGYQLAFILSTKRDTTEPLYTIRRIIVAGTWSTSQFLKAMQSSFK